MTLTAAIDNINTIYTVDFQPMHHVTYTIHKYLKEKGKRKKEKIEKRYKIKSQ